MKVEYIKETTPFLSKTIAQLTHGKIYEVDQTNWEGTHFTLTDDDGDHVIVDKRKFKSVPIQLKRISTSQFKLFEGGGEAQRWIFPIW